jgi:polyphenol oxidase
MSTENINNFDSREVSKNEFEGNIEINREEIEDGVWRPSIFEEFQDSVQIGASTKILKKIINRQDAKVRITGKKDRFDESFSKQDVETRKAKIGAGRILIELLKRVAPEADAHNIQKTALEHGNKVVVIDQEYLQKDKAERAKNLADGLITNLPEIPLMVTGADCAPVGIYDAQHQSIGVFHSGWRGTVKQISQKGVQKMREAYESRPEELLAVIGPRAGAEDFEVNKKVYDEFLNAENEEGKPVYTQEEVASFFKAQPDKPGHYFLDTGLAIKTSLLKAGLTEQHIQLSKYSTMSEEGNQLFSSERREGKEARDSFTFIMALK